MGGLRRRQTSKEMPHCATGGGGDGEEVGCARHGLEGRMKAEVRFIKSGEQTDWLDELQTGRPLDLCSVDLC